MSYLRQFAATITLNVSTLVYGLSAGWPSWALPLLRAPASPLGSPLSVQAASWLGSALCLSGLLCTPLYALAVSRWGCKPAGYLVALPMALSWMLTMWSSSLAALYAARTLAGVAAAGVFVLVPAYVRDIVQDKYRGRLGALLMTISSGGLLCSYALSLVLPYEASCGVGLVLTLVFACVFYRLPETPWCLLTAGRLREAREALRWFRQAQSEDELEEELTRMYAAVKLKQAEAEARPVSPLELVRGRTNRRAFCVAMVVCANQQLNGVFAVLTYGETILREAGSSLEPALAAVVVGAALTACSALSSLLVDRVGRRPLLLASDAGMALSTAALGGYLLARARGWPVHGLGWLPLTCLTLFVVAVSLGVFPVAFVVLTELFAPRVRDAAISAGVGLTWLLSFLAGRFYPVVASSVGDYACYWFFSGCCVVSAVFIAVALPETKGKSLQEIQAQLGARKAKEAGGLLQDVS